MELGGCIFTTPPYSTVNAASWEKVPLWLGRAGSLFCFAINPDTFAVTAKPLKSHVVCLVSNGPKLICRGTLKLGPQAAIVFDSTNPKFGVTDTVFQGAFGLSTWAQAFTTGWFQHHTLWAVTATHHLQPHIQDAASCILIPFAYIPQTHLRAVARTHESAERCDILATLFIISQKT